MLVVLRMIFGGALLYGLVSAAKYAGEHPESGDLMNAFHFGVLVIVAIANAIVWAPYFGAKLSDPLTSAITKSTYVDQKNYLLRIIRWFDARGWRRGTVFLCFLEGIHHPERPTAFVIGLKNARARSWLEKVYAREVFKFDNAQNCVEAYAALKRHGIDPRPHHRPEVNLLLMSLERSVHPEPGKVVIPPAPSPPAPQRNRQIRLFEGASSAATEAMPTVSAHPETDPEGAAGEPPPGPAELQNDSQAKPG